MANKKNKEGYLDVVPYEVISKEEKQEKLRSFEKNSFNEMVKHVKYLCRLNGWNLESIEIYSKKTNNVYSK